MGCTASPSRTQTVTLSRLANDLAAHIIPHAALQQLSGVDDDKLCQQRGCQGPYSSARLACRSLVQKSGPKPSLENLYCVKQEKRIKVGSDKATSTPRLGSAPEAVWVA